MYFRNDVRLGEFRRFNRMLIKKEKKEKSKKYLDLNGIIYNSIKIEILFNISSYVQSWRMDDSNVSYESFDFF